MGRPHGGEDRAPHRVRAAPRAARVLARRLGGGPHHRPGRAVPRAPRRRPHLLQPGPAVGQGAPGVLPVRPVGGRRRLHPELLRRGRSWWRATRRCTSARPGWPRRSSASGSRSRRWAAPGCTPPSRAAATTSPSTTPTPSSRPSTGSRTCPATGASCRRPRSANRPTVTLHRDVLPEKEAAGYDMHRFIDGLIDDGSLFEVKPLWAPEVIIGLRPPRRPPRSGSSPTTRCRRAACCSSTRPTRRPLHLAVRRLQPAAAVPGRRARLHDRHRGGAPGHHPPRRQDDHGRHRRHRAQDLRDRPQGVRRRAVRHVRTGLRPDRHAGAAYRQDRRDGSRGGGQRRVRQQDRRHRRPERSAPSSSPLGGSSTRRTSTSSVSPRSW